MDVTEGVGERELRTRIKRSFFSNPNDISVKETTNCGLWREDGIQQCAVLSSSSGPAEGYAVKKKQGGGVSESTGDDSTPLRCSHNAAAVSSIGSVRKTVSFEEFAQEMWFLRTRLTDDAQSRPRMRIVRRTTEILISKEVLFFCFFNCECGSCGL